MSSIDDDIYGEEFLNHDTDHTSPPQSPEAVPRKPAIAIRPKPVTLPLSNTLTKNGIPRPVRPKPDTMPLAVSEGSRCVIAVDFGTTFTGSKELFDPMHLLTLNKGVATAVTSARVAQSRDIILMQDYG